MTQKRTTDNDLVVSGTAAAATRRKAARPRSKHSAAAAEAPVISAPAEPETAQPASAASETTLSVTAVESPVATANSSYEEVAKLAYSYWEARGYQGGSPEEDWLRAEVEMRGVSKVTV
jgi:hypothetical protein